MQGEVIRFDPIKGYGFIAPRNGGEDVFLHVNDLLDDKHLIRSGVIVEFVAEAGERGLKASSVHVVGPTGTPAGRTPVRTPTPGRDESDSDLVDVLSITEFTHEITELLLHSEAALTGTQILQVRQALAEFARSYGWIA